nr:hypothetical protein [Tanacetum cinerariifolium]
MQLLHSCFDWNDYVCVLSGSQDASMLHNQTDCMKEQGYLEDVNTGNEDNDTMNELEDGDKTTSDEYENKNTDSDSPISNRIVRTNGDEIDGKIWKLNIVGGFLHSSRY